MHKDVVRAVEQEDNVHKEVGTGGEGLRRANRARCSAAQRRVTEGNAPAGTAIPLRQMTQVRSWGFPEQECLLIMNHSY